MPTTTTNLIQGPADVYVGAFGATEPAATAAAIVNPPSDAAWTDVGGTEGGITMSIAEEWAELEVDQIVEVPARRLTKRDVSFKTNLAEPTLDNLALALNAVGTVDVSVDGIRKLSPVGDSSATQPNYAAVILDGYAPNQLRRRIVVRKVLSTAGAELAYSKGDQTVLAVTLASHYVSPSIKSVVLVDEDPTNEV